MKMQVVRQFKKPPSIDEFIYSLFIGARTPRRRSQQWFSDLNTVYYEVTELYNYF